MKTFHIYIISPQARGRMDSSSVRKWCKVQSSFVVAGGYMMQINGVEKVVYVPIDENERGGWVCSDVIV